MKHTFVSVHTYTYTYVHKHMHMHIPGDAAFSNTQETSYMKKEITITTVHTH